MSPAPKEDPKITIAREGIETFAQKFGIAHLYLAYHCAFPLALTPTLAYQIWGEFQHDNETQHLNIPWVAVADLLLSNLCNEVEAELYEMDLAVRTVLLNELKLDAKFGKTRLNELSNFLLEFVKKQLRSKKPQSPDVAQLHEWIALAYVKPTQAARKIALMLDQQDWGNQLELVRLASVIETFVEPLAEFEALLTYGHAMGKYGRGDKAGAEDDFARLGKGKQELEIAGVHLQVPKFFTFETVTVNKKGEIIQQETKQARYFTEDLGNGVSVDMVYIPGGTFGMGSPETEAENYEDEKPQHQVTIQPFFMGKYATTQAQWKAVAQLPKIERGLDPDPSDFKGDNRPVENVSWLDAVEFCARLSQKTGKNYRLPSEAEWEYACRAGTETPFHFGETITSEWANYRTEDQKIEETLYKGTYGEEPAGEYRKETTPVGSFPFANNFGLYDMHGNVWEWCADPWHESYEGAPTDGSVWDEKDNDHRYQNSVDLLVMSGNDDRNRLLRGGSWGSLPRNCRSALRNDDAPDPRYYVLGFRFVCVWLRGPNSP
jgi:formylglycine-generating enzyme required for sulfatase activity